MQRDASHIADERFGEATDFGMARHQRRQWTAVSLDGKLTAALVYLRKATQVIESRRRGFESGAEVTLGGGTRIGEPAAAGTEQSLDQSGRYRGMQGYEQLVQDSVIWLGEELFGLGCEPIGIGGLTAAYSTPNSKLSNQTVSFKRRQMEPDSVVGQLKKGGKLFYSANVTPQ
jgi:hypothetical protein